MTKNVGRGGNLYPPMPYSLIILDISNPPNPHCSKSGGKEFTLISLKWQRNKYCLIFIFREINKRNLSGLLENAWPPKVESQWHFSLIKPKGQFVLLEGK